MADIFFSFCNQINSKLLLITIKIIAINQKLFKVSCPFVVHLHKIFNFGHNRIVLYKLKWQYYAKIRFVCKSKSHKFAKKNYKETKTDTWQ